jgi:hypothetical protein
MSNAYRKWFTRMMKAWKKLKNDDVSEGHDDEETPAPSQKKKGKPSND